MTTALIVAGAEDAGINLSEYDPKLDATDSESGNGSELDSAHFTPLQEPAWENSEFSTIRKFLSLYSPSALERFCSSLGLPATTSKGCNLQAILELLSHQHRSNPREYDMSVRNMLGVFKILYRPAHTTTRQFRIPGYEQPEVAMKILQRSKDLCFRISLPEPLEIVRYITDPLLFPLVPCTFNGILKLSFLDFKEGRVPGHFYLGLFLRLNNPESFKMSSPFPNSIEYSFDDGSWFWKHHALKEFPGKDSEKELTFKVPHFPAMYISSDHAYPSIQFSMIQTAYRPLPFYFVAVQVKMKSIVDHGLLSRNLVRGASEVIKQALSLQEKAEVQASTVQLSLRCPISMTRLQIPIRLPGCSHLQCMDESSWDVYKAGVPFGKKLTCPVCDRPVEKETEAFIDGFTLDILRNVDKKVYEVCVDMEAQCKWTPMLPEHSEDESDEDAPLLALPSKSTPLGKRRCDRYPEWEIVLD